MEASAEIQDELTSEEEGSGSWVTEKDEQISKDSDDGSAGERSNDASDVSMQTAPDHTGWLSEVVNISLVIEDDGLSHGSQGLSKYAHSQQPVDMSYNYTVTTKKLKTWKQAVEELYLQTGSSWAKCTEQELISEYLIFPLVSIGFTDCRRQANAPETLCQILDMLAYTSRVETFAASLLVSPCNGHSGFM